MTQGPATPSLRASRAISLASGEPLPQQATARSCRHPECSTRLSRYNPDETCARHGGWVAAEPPRRRRRPSEEEIDLTEAEETAAP
jgi:hypothetical protein